MEAYEQRFWDEYLQLIDRLAKLNAMLGNWDCLNFVPSCTKAQLELQAAAMLCYQRALEGRADFNGIKEKAAA